MERKVSDMNKDFVITFLQEYSHYVKNIKENREVVTTSELMCPTEFFNKEFLQILKDTDRTEDAFIPDDDNMNGILIS